MTLDEFRRARSAEKRSAILAAAFEQFRLNGFGGATMDEIAGAAKVSTATLYRHFASKTALFQAIAAQSIEAFHGGETRSSADPLARLTDLACAYARRLSEPRTRSIARMLIAAVGDGGELADAFYAGVKTKLSEAFADAVASAVARGDLQEGEDPAHMAGQLQGMIEHGTLLYGLILGDAAVSETDPDQIAASAMDTWLARWRR